jgi:large subunit ribosomal protein L25
MAAKIKFTSRTGAGTGACRKLRARGVVPAVFYGPEYAKSVVGSVNERELLRVVDAPNWETNMIDLEMPDGRVEMALLRSVQRNVVSNAILHIDLYQLVKDRKVRVDIPIRLVNRDVAIGVKMGGVLEQPMREVEILVLPREIPSEIVLDAAKMSLGSEVLVRDLELPPSAELVTPEDSIVVLVAHPRADVGTPEEETAEATEVEVVGKGKRREEGE